MDKSDKNDIWRWSIFDVIKIRTMVQNTLPPLPPNGPKSPPKKLEKKAQNAKIWERIQFSPTFLDEMLSSIIVPKKLGLFRRYYTETENEKKHRYYVVEWFVSLLAYSHWRFFFTVIFFMKWLIYKLKFNQSIAKTWLSDWRNFDKQLQQKFTTKL